MDKQLSLGHYLIITVLILLLNNVALFYFFGSDSSEDISAQTNEFVTALSESKTLKNVGTTPVEKTRSKNSVVDRLDESRLDETQDLEENTEVTNVVKDYITSDEFLKVLDNYNSERQEAQNEFGKEIALLSASELISAYSNTSERWQKSWVLGVLSQKDLTEVETYQLKEFYNAEDLNSRVKERVLVAMLDQNDEEALSIAKQYVVDGDTDIDSYELWNRLVDLDRDFTFKTASEMPIDQISKIRPLISNLYQEPEGLKVFFENQLDNILDAEDPKVFDTLQYTGSSVTIDLSDSQQQKFGKLLSSKNRSKRNFAFGFVGNLDDTDMLRDRYNELTFSQDKRDFVYGLTVSTESDAHKQLLSEILEATDDSQLKQLNSQLKQLKGNF